MPTPARWWDVFPVVKFILRRNIIFAALHGIILRRGGLLLWRRLILRQFLRFLGINCLQRILLGIALCESDLLRRVGFRRRRGADHP